MSLAQARTTSAIFDGERLRVARQLRKLSRAALAGRVGVSATAVGQWETEESRPRPSLVVKLSETLDVPVQYFATSGRQLPDIDASCSFFRSLRKSRQVDRNAAMAHAVLISELVVAIERHAKLPKLDIPRHPLTPDAPIERVEEIAEAVRQEWDLGDEPVDNVVREIEIHGAVTVRLALADHVDAFSWPNQTRRPIVILGRDKDVRNRSRFDAAHELGHLVMHFDHPEPDSRDLETQAHRFAGAFLLPAHRLEDEWPAGHSRWPELLHLKQRWQVSLAALIYRARQLGLLSDSGYLSAVKYMSRAGWRRREPGDIGSPERPRLLRHAMRALEHSGRTLDDLAEEARLPLPELREYLATPGSTPRVDVHF